MGREPYSRILCGIFAQNALRLHNESSAEIHGIGACDRETYLEAFASLGASSTVVAVAAEGS